LVGFTTISNRLFSRWIILRCLRSNNDNLFSFYIDLPVCCIVNSTLRELVYSGAELCWCEGVHLHTLNFKKSHIQSYIFAFWTPWDFAFAYPDPIDQRDWREEMCWRRKWRVEMHLQSREKRRIRKVQPTEIGVAATTCKTCAATRFRDLYNSTFGLLYITSMAHFFYDVLIQNHKKLILWWSYTIFIHYDYYLLLNLYIVYVFFFYA
jgi:hypothetical protein